MFPDFYAGLIHNVIRMPFERSKHAAGSDVPQVDRAIHPARGKRLPVGRKLRVNNGPFMPLDSKHFVEEGRVALGAAREALQLSY